MMLADGLFQRFPKPDYCSGPALRFAQCLRTGHLYGWTGAGQRGLGRYHGAGQERPRFGAAHDH